MAGRVEAVSVPNLYELVVLALAAFRTWQLLANDLILERPRRHVTGVWADWLSCCWCSGLWFAFGWIGAWEAWPHPTLVAAAFMAASALVGIIASLLPD